MAATATINKSMSKKIEWTWSARETMNAEQCAKMACPVMWTESAQSFTWRANTYFTVVLILGVASQAGCAQHSPGLRPISYGKHFVQPDKKIQ